MFTFYCDVLRGFWGSCDDDGEDDEDDDSGGGSSDGNDGSVNGVDNDGGDDNAYGCDDGGKRVVTVLKVISKVVLVMVIMLESFNYP